MSHQHNPKRDEKGTIRGGDPVPKCRMRKQYTRNDPHRFLGIIRPVTETVGRGRNQLSASKEAVCLFESLFTKDPVNGYNENSAEQQTDQGRDHNEREGFRPAFGDNHTETSFDNSRARITADQRMRGTGGQAYVPG